MTDLDHLAGADGLKLSANVWREQGLSEPVLVTFQEGGVWWPYKAGDETVAHSARFADGREWDEVNGWRPDRGTVVQES